MMTYLIIDQASGNIEEQFSFEENAIEYVSKNRQVGDKWALFGLEWGATTSSLIKSWPERCSKQEHSMPHKGCILR